MFDDATVRAVGRIAARMRLAPEILLAVAEVESGGRVYAVIGGEKEPLIRFEGHYFDERLSGADRETARRLGLASPRAGAVKNPRTQLRRWKELYLRAAAIDPVAAFESTSWGLGQVMGAHWKALGFKNPTAMLALARSGAAGQIEIMARYIERFGLADELQRQDFRAFARGYNGRGGIKAGYHTKIAAAYKRLTGTRPTSAAAGMLSMGAAGAKVRELQTLLRRAGQVLDVDGDFGPATKRAVAAFQADNGLAVDGVAGPETMRALAAYRQTPDEKPGQLGLLETPQAATGGASAGGGVGLTVAADQINAVADRIGFMGVGWTDTVVAGLYVAGGTLVIGGLAWGAWGWWKSRRTEND